jgi:hypothetical protein
VAIGADVVHMHSHVSGAALGEATMIDFRIVTTAVTRLEGGVWINLGCAALLPEVFLKAVSAARNLGYSLDGLVTANLDMIQQYRGRVNVCERPGDEGIQITGHHEILVPLIHAVVTAKIAAEPAPACADSKASMAGARPRRTKPAPAKQRAKPRGRAIKRS